MEVLPVFVRAAKLLAWCVPKRATSRIMRLVECTICGEAKVANNGRALRDTSCTDARSVLITMSGRKSSEGGPIRYAQRRSAG